MAAERSARCRAHDDRLELDYQQQAAQRRSPDAGVPANRIRLITGRAAGRAAAHERRQLRPRLHRRRRAAVLDYVEHGLRIVRRGGTVLVAHALWRGRVADPAQRDDTVADFRVLLTTIAESDAVISALSTAGDGLLQLDKISD